MTYVCPVHELFIECLFLIMIIKFTHCTALESSEVLGD